MESKLLLERVPELSGNVVITVKKNGDVFLNIIKTNQALSISQMQDFPVNTTFGLVNDYSNYLAKNSYRNLNDKIADDTVYSKDNYIMTSLLICEKIPDLFIICNKENDGTIKLLQYYDLSEKTVLGKYLIDFKNEFVDINPITINTNKREISINGINLVSGIINKFHILYEEGDDLNRKILLFIKENKILIPNILNIEFESEYYNTNVKYYYSDKVPLFNYDIQNVPNELYIKNNNLYIKSSCLTDNNHVKTADNIPMSFVDDSFFLAYIDTDGKIIGLKNESECLLLKEDLKINTEDISEISLEKVYNPVSYSIFENISDIEQSEFIEVYSSLDSIQLVSDYMPNLIQAGINFSPTDNNYSTFNYIGTRTQTMIAFSKAWNDTMEKKTKIKCVPFGEKIIFIDIFGGAFDIKINSTKIVNVKSFQENILKYSYYKITKADHIDRVSNKDYVFIDKKPYKVFDVVDNIYYDQYEKIVVNDGKLLVLLGDTNQEVLDTTITSFKNPTIGVLNIMDNIVYKKKFINNEKNYFDISNFIRTDSIKSGVEYKVVSINTKILYENIEYNSNDTFTGNIDTKYYIKKGVGNICELEFSEDLELESLMNIDIINNEVVSENLILSQNYNSDFDNQVPNMLFKISPKDNVFVTDIYNRTSEWSIPTKYPYIDKKYEISEIDIRNGVNYSKSLLEKISTKFEKNGSVYKTTFRGVEIITKENVNGYSFASIINIHNEDDYNGGIKNRIIKNDLDGYIIYLIDIPISDYRFINRFNFCLVQNSKNSKESSTSNHISYDLNGLIINGLKIKCSIAGMYDDKIKFNQKTPIKLLITESNDGISLIFRNIDGSTILSNYGYVSGTSVEKETNVFKVSLSENNVVLTDGFLYVSRINGVTYNSIMHYSDIATIVNFDSIECYQIGNFENDLENLFSLINFSNIKENINLKKYFIESIVINVDGSTSTNLNIDLELFQNTNYSGQYNIPIEIVESHAGSTTPNIFGVNAGVWKNQNHTWIEDVNSIDILDKYFNKKLNLTY